MVQLLPVDGLELRLELHALQFQVLELTLEVFEGFLVGGVGVGDLVLEFVDLLVAILDSGEGLLICLALLPLEFGELRRLRLERGLGLAEFLLTEPQRLGVVLAGFLQLGLGGRLCRLADLEIVLDLVLGADVIRRRRRVARIPGHSRQALRQRLELGPVPRLKGGEIILFRIGDADGVFVDAPLVIELFALFGRVGQLGFGVFLLVIESSLFAVSKIRHCPQHEAEDHEDDQGDNQALFGIAGWSYTRHGVPPEKPETCNHEVN